MKNFKKFLIISLFLGILVAGPGLVSQAQAAGLTQSQISAIISLLQSFGVGQVTIGNVQAILTGAPTAPASVVWCYNFNINLKYGDSGSEVGALQKSLTKEGFTTKESLKFDEQTAAAVSGFQQKYASEILTPVGLKYGTGFVGVSTRAKLNSLYGCVVAVAPTPIPIPSLPPSEITPTPTPTPIPTPTPVSTTTQPSITVLSPNGGEVWEIGSTQTIRWNSSNVSKVSIWLCKSGICSRFGSIPATGIPNLGLYEITISTSNTPFNVYAPSSDLKIRVASEDNYPVSTVYDDSNTSFSIAAATVTNCVDSDGGKNYYTKGYCTWSKDVSQHTDSCTYDTAIKTYTLYETYCDSAGNIQTESYKCPSGCSDGACLSATATPSITVVSPNGEERLSIGSIYPVKVRISGEAEISFNLYKGSIKLGHLVGSYPTEGTYNWEVGKYRSSADEIITVSPADDYRIGAILGYPGNPIDFSDTAFSIVAAITTPSITIVPATQPSATLAVRGAIIPFTKFTLTAGNSDVTISGIRINKGTGFVNDAAFPSVFLMDENGMRVGVSKLLDSNHQATVGDIFTIKAGQTKTLTIAGEMASNLETFAGQTAYFSVIGINTSAAVSGSLPITGTSQTINNSLTIGSLSVSGTNSLVLTASNVEDIRLDKIAMFNTGDSINVNGVTYACSPSLNICSFGSSGVVIPKNGTVKIIPSSLTAYLDSPLDIVSYGQTYGYRIVPKLVAAGVGQSSQSNQTASALESVREIFLKILEILEGR